MVYVVISEVIYIVENKYQTMFYREILHEEYTRVPSEREREIEREFITL